MEGKVVLHKLHINNYDNNDEYIGISLNLVL